MAAGKVPLGLVIEPPPQEIRDNEAQNSVAEEFEALIASVGCVIPAAPAASLPRDKSARMGQGFLEECGPGETVPDYLC